MAFSWPGLRCGNKLAQNLFSSWPTSWDSIPRKSTLSQGLTLGKEGKKERERQSGRFHSDQASESVQKLSQQMNERSKLRTKRIKHVHFFLGIES